MSAFGTKQTLAAQTGAVQTDLGNPIRGLPMPAVISSWHSPKPWGRQMRRREFITLLGSAATVWPVTARAQQSARVPAIGFLGAATPITWEEWVAAFVQRLRELGWIDGRTIAIDFRWAEGRSERYTEIGAEFVRLKVDVIVTVGIAVSALKQLTSVIPVVSAAASDPVGSGLVASLARPGGNVTGLSNQSAELVSKRCELLREILRGLRTIAVMGNPGYSAALLEMREVEAAARTLGLEIETAEVSRAEDISRAFVAFKTRVQAIYVCSDALMNANSVRINTLALGAHLPTMFATRSFVDGGGLMAYGTNNADLFRRAGDYVDKILRGAKPGDIPVEQPTKFDLVINLTTAKALGLTIPESFLLRADEVIE
jgi:putative tryptophan/tyrosine transport system substrate-binding protein